MQAGLHVGRKCVPSLRMAPMIDIIFLLLIFFLVTAKWRPQESFLPFQLPKADAGYVQFGKPEPLVIGISATDTGCSVQIGKVGGIEINDTNIQAGLTGLMKKMQECFTEQKRFATDPVEINCGPAVRWEHLARIYNIFYGAGINDITFTLTEHSDDGQFD